MNNPPEIQAMNRRVLEALSITQDGKSVAMPFEIISSKILPLIQGDNDVDRLNDNILKSLTTLKKVGLVRESRNKEYTLCRCPVKSRSARTKKRKSTASLATQMKAKKMKSLWYCEHKPRSALCTECRSHSVLSSFNDVCRDIRQGLKVSSRLNIAELRKRNTNGEPVEIIGDNGANGNVATPADVGLAAQPRDGGGDAATPITFSFNPPIPIELAEERGEH